MSSQPITIHFLGAAQTVTGSKYLINAYGKNILVDCGMFQGLKSLRLLNWESLPVPIDSIDLVVLTHGHLDHCGYLPRLVHQGFKRIIMGTEPTLKVARIILEDSARIQEEEADRANRKGYSKHSPAKPLYTEHDVEKTITHFRPQPLNEWISFDENIKIRFRYVGHIIGASFVEIKIKEERFVFSGDVGREKDVLMLTPDRPEKADYLFVESTYGNRFHEANIEKRFSNLITECIKRQGTIIIPSFAVERTQSIMYLLWKLREENVIPGIPIYMDSPMGKNVMDVFREFPSWHQLSEDHCNDMCKDIKIVQSIEETHELANSTRAKIIIAGSGMATGGRVLTYLQHYLPDPNATILFAGYQAEGTRGRRLLEGEKEIKIYGEFYPVRAHIENIEGLSSHADQNELIDWMKHIQNKPKKVFIIHGETDGMNALSQRIQEEFKWSVEIPKLYDIIELE